MPLFQPARLNKPTNIAQCLSLKADVIVVAAYGLIIPSIILNYLPHGGINVHTSLLPRWRGAAPIQHAILAGDQETGITIMNMSKALDCGDIVDQEVCPITLQDTAGTLLKKLAPLGCQSLLSTLEKLDQSIPLQLTPQRNEEASYAPKIDKVMAHIDWNQSAEYIVRLIRALNPKPIAYTIWSRSQNERKRLKISSAEAVPCQKMFPEGKNRPAGTIIAFTKQGLEVATGNNQAVRILTQQLEGRSQQNALDFFNAFQKHFKPRQTFLT